MPLEPVRIDGADASAVRGLHATPTASLPYVRGVVVRSFLLERAQGNVIVYNSPGVTAAARDILARGRPERLLLTHWHEAMFGPPRIAAPVFVHERDRSRTDLPIAGAFSQREKIGDDLEILPTPGHTAGTIMFLWNNGERRILFSGDAIWVQGGEWRAVLLGDSDRAAYLDSLALLMQVEFDILAPWGGEEGEPCGYAVEPAEARRKLGRIADRLRAGENA